MKRSALTRAAANVIARLPLSPDKEGRTTIKATAAKSCT